MTSLSWGEPFPGRSPVYSLLAVYGRQHQFSPTSPRLLRPELKKLENFFRREHGQPSYLRLAVKGRQYPLFPAWYRSILPILKLGNMPSRGIGRRHKPAAPWGVGRKRRFFRAKSRASTPGGKCGAIGVVCLPRANSVARRSSKGSANLPQGSAGWVRRSFMTGSLFCLSDGWVGCFRRCLLGRRPRAVRAGISTPFNPGLDA
jgi:hypothetical protein